MVGYRQYENLVALIDDNDGEWETLENQAHGAPLCSHTGHGYQRESLCLQ
jgi:hypothetical protein